MKSNTKTNNPTSSDRRPLARFGGVAAVLLLLWSARGALGQTAPAATRPAGKHGAEVYRLVNESGEIVSVLDNGLTVIAKRVPSPAVSVRGYVRTGGVYEGKWLGGGLSHLLEHLVAGGSSARRSEAESRSLLQELGNNSNAYTAYDHTCFYINTTPDHAEQAIDLLTGWLFGAEITEDEYRREYEVVQRELEKGKGEPGRQFYLLSNANRYRVHPARVPVVGYQEVIQGLSRDDVFNYYKLAYVPSNMLLIVAGDVEPQAMLAAMQRMVDDVPPGREFSRELPDEPLVYAPRTLVATFPKLGQANVSLGFPSIKLDHPDLYALDLLSSVLSDGESSLLVEEIRDKLNLVSAIGSSSYTPTYADGTFSVGMMLDPDKVAEASDAVLKLLAKVAEEGVSEDRLARAKTQVRVQRVKGLQTAEDIASSLATDFLSTGDPHFGDRYVAAIEKVTAEQVQAMARKYFDQSKLLTTVLLPAEHVGAAGLPAAEDLIRAVAPTTRETTEAESKVTRLELANGTVLLHKRITTSPLVVMNMYALGGLTVEDAKTNGIGNLTMNLLPRGTTRRSAQEIAELFDSIGGDLGSGCGNNTWFWTATCLKEDLEKAAEAYGDVVFNPSFPETELVPMRQRVVAAIASLDADWRQQATRFFKQIYFGAMNSPYQFLPIGQIPNVSAVKADELRAWYEKNVLTAPRVLAIYGDVTLEDARRVAEQHLGGGPKVSPISRLAAQANAGVAARDFAGAPAIEIARVETQQTQQPLAGVVMGFDAHPYLGDPANFAMTIADTMSSGYGFPTGYLHETLRGRGLVYEVHAMNSPGRSPELPGTFIAYAGCDPKRVNEVVDLMLENLARLQGTPEDLQPDWFHRSKQLVITADAMDNQTPAEQATTAALDELYGLGYDFHEQFPRQIEALTIDDVRAASRDRLRKVVVTISTPMPDLVKAKPGTRTYESFSPLDLTPRGIQHDVQH